MIFHGNDKFFGQTFHRRKTLKNPYFDIKKKQIKKTRREIADGQSIGTRENYDKEFKFVKKKFKKIKGASFIHSASRSISIISRQSGPPPWLIQILIEGVRDKK